MPLTLPVEVRAVAMLATVLPNWLLNGVGVVPPLTVPPEYTLMVAAALMPPDIPEIYNDLPLPEGFVIWISKLEPDATLVLAVVTMNSSPLMAALPSG